MDDNTTQAADVKSKTTKQRSQDSYNFSSIISKIIDGP